MYKLCAQDEIVTRIYGREAYVRTVPTYTP